MVDRRDPIERVVDVAFGVPIAGTALTRDLTKLALHGALRSVQRAGAELAVRFVDGRAASSAGLEADRANSVAPPADIAVRLVDDPVERVRAGREEVVRDDVVEVVVERDDDDDDAVSDRRVVVAELAIDGYEHLSARQIVGLLEELDAAELSEIAAFERATRARRTVLGKVEQLQAEHAAR